MLQLTCHNYVTQKPIIHNGDAILRYLKELKNLYFQDIFDHFADMFIVWLGLMVDLTGNYDLPHYIYGSLEMFAGVLVLIIPLVQR